MIFYGSRYSTATAYLDFTEDNIPVVILGNREELKFDKRELQYHLFTQGDRLDKLSYKYYGDTRYAFFILDANPKYQSPLDIEVGDIIAIPPITRIMEAIEIAS